ncbi:MAG: DNA starvation/stationary phase protection protein [Acholeplasmataceae bacterium]|nr:DNA starvation/stationary phase protection protein [Acholeplasmataceae bacterium]
MNKLITLLNKEVANFGVLYTKLHNFHWLVEGNQFYQLHAKFEELYDEATEHFDALAERILMLEGRPVATLKEFLELATIKEANGGENDMAMVEAVVDDFALIDKELSEGIKLAEAVEDDVTVDLLTGIRSSLQKHLWMLRTVLK